MESHEGMPIFLVIGETGEYEDRREWVVCAYRNYEQAYQHAKMADEESSKLFQERDEKFTTIKHKGVYDENMVIDYTGTSYFVEETILHHAFLRTP
jgi:hypothetical protein